MDVREFTRSVGQQTPPPIILICPGKAGPRAREVTYEPFLAERAVEALISAYVDPGLKDLSYSAYYADETKPGEIVLEAQTVPFLAERRVILVRGAERYAGENSLGPLLSYIEAPSDQTLLILVATAVDKRTKFYKACEKNGVIVESPELAVGDAIQWASAEIAAKGKTAAMAAVQEIVRRTGSHLSDLNNAINVVLGYVGEAPSIREADVVAACADVAEEEVWALTDAIAGGKPAAALGALRKLLDLGRHEDELLGTINWLIKTAYTLTRTDGGASQVTPFVANKIRPLADKIGARKMRDAFALCSDTHFMIRSTGVDGALALELLVIKLSAAGRRPQRA